VADATATEPRPARPAAPPNPEQVTGWVTGAVLLALTTFLVYPVALVFGTIDTVTAVVNDLSRLALLGWAAAALRRLLRLGRWLWAAEFAALLVLAAAAFSASWQPVPATPAHLVALHRHDLSQLAGAYRAGHLHGTPLLAPPIRTLSYDGRAHPECGFTGHDPAARVCALYLPSWRDWRAERGTGLAYFPTRPDPTTAIATAAGDLGSPVQDLGGGWWWIA
jgi:hypothetical protein